MVRIESDKSALLLVDIQPDFMPGGALAVGGGDEIIEPVSRLVGLGGFRAMIATQDWHPLGHVSFASSHPGRRPFEVMDLYGRPQTLWPDHCVQGTPGAEIHRDIPTNTLAAFIRKGTDPRCDSYSGFRNNCNSRGERPATGLGGYLKDLGITDLYLCGLARDFCVQWSAEDAAEAGFVTWFIWDLTRPVDPASDERVRSDLLQRGVRIIGSEQLRP
jgi:nicotinamidase/pyrazinamidase